MDARAIYDQGGRSWGLEISQWIISQRGIVEEIYHFSLDIAIY